MAAPAWLRRLHRDGALLVLAALAAGALAFTLLLRLPDGGAPGTAQALQHAHDRLGQAIAAGDATSLRRAQAELASQVAAVQAAQDEFDTQQRHLAWALKGSGALLAVALLLLMHTLSRQRRRVGRTLRQASEQLDAGEWQRAVQRLRHDRLGSPSAFDALATGMEGALGESERRWQALAELSADWYWECDAQHRLSWLSGSSPAVTVLGWAPDELLGKRRDQLAFLDPPPQGWAELHARMTRGEPFRDLEFRALGRRDSGEVWVSISGRPRLDRHGRLVGYEGVGRNITERRIAHDRLVASEQRWSLMAGLASDWYWETDAEHRMRPLARELVRRAPDFAERTVGRTRWDAHRDALTPAQWAEHRADLDARRPFRSLQFEAEDGRGGFVWLSISGIPRFDGQGRFLGYHGVGRDVTVRKQAERLLLRHNEELQRAVAERTQELQHLNIDLDAFSRQLAHELRTPISHVQGLAHLIEARAGTRLHADERQLLALQVEAARSMRETVDALMMLARSTVQAMPMATVDVSALAVQVLGELPVLERRAAVEWHVEPGLVAHGCTAALRIVLANLLGNAAKFTRQVARPVVQVQGGLRADGRLHVSVRDNGAGFDPTQAGRLFKPFSRLHAGEDFAGTGIGLSIVQRIVERHGGTVAAHGEPGAGARFEFTLEAARDAPPPGF